MRSERARPDPNKDSAPDVEGLHDARTRIGKEGTTMRSNDFTATFTVDRTPEEVFAAINDVRGWQSGTSG
jgi:hypothetical protein